MNPTDLQRLEILADYSGPEIELKTNLGLIDLHNFGDLADLSYNPFTRQLALKWVPSQPDKLTVGQTPVTKVIVTFESVKKLLITYDKETHFEPTTLAWFYVEQMDSTKVEIKFQFEGMSLEVKAYKICVLIPKHD